MNIYKYELKSHLKSILIWTAALVLMIVLFMTLFPAMSKEAEKLQKIMQGFPVGLRKAMGITVLDISTVMGFYGFLFTYILLIGSIQAMTFGASVMSKEVAQKTADFLFVKPVTRTSIVVQKVLAVFSALIITNAIYALFAKIMMDMVKLKDYDSSIFFKITGSLFLIQIFFLTFGMMVSVMMNKLKGVTPLAMGSVFGFFVINLLNQSLDEAKLSAITPFAYFEPSKIVESGGYNTTYLILTAVFSTIFVLVTYFIYKNKDIPSV